jgi:16S rRNA (uracil1498-N3)-methyltransferase
VRQPPWFYALPEAWDAGHVTLDEQESHHALKVLRVAPLDLITVTNGLGVVARCSVREAREGRVIAEIVQSETRRRPRPDVVVYQGAAKGTKVDSVVERLAELGVAELWAYESSRSVARWSEAKVARLNERWSAIARAAAKQCRSAFLMQATAGLDWADLLERVAKEPLAVTLWEEAALPLRTAFIGEADRVALIVGPEGGFSREEAEELADHRAQLTSLGPLIVRTEHAAVVATAALLYHFGLIG